MKKNFMKVAISLLCVMTLLFGSVLTFSIPASAATFTTVAPTKATRWNDDSWQADGGWRIYLNVNNTLPEALYYNVDAVPVVVKDKDGKVLGDFNDPANKLYSTFQRHGDTQMSAYIYAGNGYTKNNAPKEGDTITMAAGSYVSNSNADVGIKLEYDLVLFYSNNQWHLGREIDDSAELLTGMGMAPDWAQSATGLYTKVLQETNLTEVRTDGNIEWDTAKGNFFFPANYESGTFFNGNRFNVKDGEGLFYSAAASDLGFYITSFGTATVGDKVVMKGSFHSPNTGESFTLKMPITFTYAGDKNWCVTYDVAVPSGLREVNWSSFGINVGDTLAGGRGNNVNISMNNSIFNVDVIFPTAAKWRFFGSETNSWLSADIAVDESGNLVFSNSGNPCSFAEQKTIYPAAVGLSSFIGTQFNLKIAVTDMSADGKSSYWNVWVNDQHVLGTTVSHTDGAAHGFGQTMECISGEMTACATTKPLPVPNHLPVISWADFNIPATGEFVKGAFKLQTNGNSMNNTILNGDMSVHETYKTFYIAGARGEASHGFTMRAVSDCTQLQFNAGAASPSCGSFTLTASDFGLTSFAERFNFKMMVTNVNGASADFKIWINDISANSFTATLADAYATNAPLAQYMMPWDSETAFKFYPSTKPIAGADGSIPEDVVPFTWEDVITMTDGTYTKSTNGYYKSYSEPIGDVLLQGYVTFAGIEELNVFGPSSNWNWGGVKFTPSAGNHAVLNVSGSEAIKAGMALNIPASAVGATTFVNEKFLLQVSAQYIDYDKDGAEDDLKLGIWINGVNAFMVDTLRTSNHVNGFKYVVDHLTTNSTGPMTGGMMIYPPNGTSVTLESYHADPIVPEEPDEPVEIEIPEASATITWGDFDNGGKIIEKQEYAGDPYAVYGWATNYTSLDGLKFVGEVKMSVGGQIHYGGSDPSHGMQLVLQNDGTLKFYNAFGTQAMADGSDLKNVFTAAELGIDGAIADQHIKVAFQMWQVTTTTARYAAWVNDTLLGVYDVAFTVDGVVCGDAISLMYGSFVVGPKPIVVEIPEAVGELTWFDFGVTDATAYTDGGWLYGGLGYTPNDYKFVGKVKLANNAYVNYGTGSLQWAFYLRQTGSGIELNCYGGQGTLTVVNGKKNYTAAELGVTGAMADTEFLLGIQMWDMTDDKKSARFAVWFNDIQLGVYDLAITHADVTLGQYAAIHDTTKTSTATSDFGTPQQLPTDFTELRPYDFGISDGIFNTIGIVAQGEANITSYDQKILVFDSFTATNAATIAMMAPNISGPYGLRFRVQADGTAVLESIYQNGGMSIPSTTFVNENAGVDIQGGTYSLKFSFEFIEDNTKLKLGVWFNDVLYNNRYITIGNLTDEHRTAIGLKLAASNSHTDGDLGKLAIASKHWAPLTGLTSVNFGSFSGVVENTKYTNKQLTLLSGSSLLNTSFRGNMTFHYETSGEYYLCYGGITDVGSWHGLRFLVRPDKIAFQNAGGTEWSNSAKLSMTPDAFGLTSFTDQELEIGVDLVMYGDTNDMLLYFYVNGKLYNDAPLVLFDFGDQISNTIVMYAANGDNDYYQTGSFTRALEYDLYHDLSKNDYVYYDRSGAKKTVSNPGVYEIEWNDGAFVYTQTVIAYVTGDANGDKAVNVLDVVKTMVTLNGGASSALFDKAADVNDDYDVTNADVIALRNRILGKVEEEGSVMPIGGFYGPIGSLVNEDIFQAIADMGITEIVSTDYLYQNSITNAVTWHNMLTMAQNNGIGMYVTDDRLNGNTAYTAAQLNALVQAYNHFQSFAGIRVIDEPGIVVSNKLQCYPLNSDWAHTLDQYDDLAISLANADITGYVNLLPYWKSLAINSDGSTWDAIIGGSNPKESASLSDATAHTRYYNYVKTVVETMKLPYVSYDHYPFDSQSVTNCAEYFQNMAIIATLADQKGLDWRPHLQAGSNWNDKAESMKPTANDTPSEGEFYWNANISLAMGAKALQYFPMIQPQHFAKTEGDTMDYERNGLIGANGELTTWGEYATALNTYVKKIDDVLMNAEHKGVIATGGYAQSVGTANISKATDNIGGASLVLDSYGCVEEVYADDDTYGAFVGCFDGTGKYAGKTIYYVVNYNVDDAQVVELYLDSEQDYEILYTNDEYDWQDCGDTITVEFEMGGEAALVIVG